MAPISLLQWHQAACQEWSLLPMEELAAIVDYRLPTAIT